MDALKQALLLLVVSWAVLAIVGALAAVWLVRSVRDWLGYGDNE